MRKDWAGSGVDLHLEVAAGGGRRRGLEEALRRAVRDGRLPRGTRLPSTRSLAAELGLSRGTVSAAYDQLVAEGYLATRPGSATEVADVSPATPSDPRLSSEPPPAPPYDLRLPAGPSKTPPYDLRLPAGPSTTPLHDLRPGQPDLSAFPARAWLRATRHVLSTAPAEVLGPCDPRGRIELRAALAGYLARTRGVLTTPDLIVVTTGFVQALNLIVQVVDGPIATEEPGHDFYREVLRRAGRQTVPLPVDGLGAQVDTLTGATAAAVVTPAHQYPTGVPLHPARRRALREWGGLVVEDDYDGEFRYDRQPVGAFQGTAPDRVVYVGTTSEALAPALRLGWMAVPPSLIGPVAEAKLHADAHTEVLGQLVLARLIETHDYDRHIRAARLRYRRRRELLLARLGPGPGQPLPGVALPGVAAGLRALLLLPEAGPAEGELLAECERRGIALRAASPLWRGDGPGGLLVGYAAPSERAYPRALEALAGALAGT
ncbi:PLP-dependent aminotransferase family protein [Nonomuraea angiospora]|uniref:GntR family transcriptional regulator/MocR family aminotransferase n=1 Tax=Nonomuraea angiospora TaxID=46172 RepID=A0ABR9M141_9ACTN|nr:PLP-dependent aminotransferase family protein [Nonomuraea angiospora]MBE1586228.1 GntR family transcriptional regulator/MocR family aminotransferase [Nonomuraea angiospora]